ncbi:MAG: DUF3455 domain-containing protein [Burkholderiaceae bacterium]|jgi:hypothetical protein|nr:DUF3455 domain-containing protein [Burkholderiaceae bacterium]
MNRIALAGSAAALLLAACATPPPAPVDGAGRQAAAPSLGWLSRIKVPDGNDAALQLAARGDQIFRCERIGDAYEWRFRQPEAELFDAQGQSAGRHGAGFSFEHRDGSRLLGTVVAHDRAEGADALPWLLLSAKSYGKGALGGISYVQRVNTRGGMPPRSCDASQAGRLLRVDFSADFVFYRPRG